MPTPVDVMRVPVHGTPLPVPTEVLHAIQAKGRLVTDRHVMPTSVDAMPERV